MTFKITNLNQEVHVGSTMAEVERYMALHHPNQRGFSKRTLARKTPKNFGDSYIKGNFTVEKINGDRRRKMLAGLRQNNTIVTNFADKVETTFNSNVIINIYSMYHIVNQIRDQIRNMNLPNMNRQSFKIVLITEDNQERTELNIGTTYLAFNAVIDELIIKLTQALQQYDNNIVLEKISIFHLLGVADLGQQVIYGRKAKNATKIEDMLMTFELIGEMVINKNSNTKLLNLLKHNRVFSPSTNKNCFIKACYVARYKETNVNQKTKDFLRTHRDKIEEYTCNILAPILSNTLQRNINVHFIEFEITTLKYGTFTESIDIVIYNSHAIALIKRDMTIPLVIAEKEQELIEKPEYKKKEGDEFILATFDMETCDEEEDRMKKNNTIAYAIGFYDGKKYKEFYMRNKTDDVVKRFIKYLFYTYTEKKIIIYSHNGGKFDIYLLFETILKQKGIVITSFMEQSGRIINLQLNDNKKTLILRDSINLIAGSLDGACKSFKPKTKKLEGDVIHEKININNCHAEGEKIDINGTMKSVREYTSGYLKNDCLSLHEILTIFDGIITTTYNFAIKDVLTNASIARRLYLSKYYDEKKTPLYRLTPEVDKQLRKYYFGGRNEVFTKLGHTKKKLFYLDFTSLYPYIMSKYKIQFGKMNLIDVLEADKTKFNKKWFGFVKCRFKHTHKKEIPLHAILKDSKLMFTYCDTWQEAIISTEEIRYSIDNNIGYEYEFIKVFNYKQKAVHFKPIVDYLYKMKIQAQKDSNEALRSIAKIIINSLYGFFGINYIHRDQTIIKLERDGKAGDGVTKASSKTEAKLYGYLSSQQLKDYKKVAGYDVYQINAPIKAGCANVGIASMITSYSRMELYKLMKDLKSKGGNLYYCDTDSIITDYNIYEDDEMYKKWVRTGGDKLGELTNETDEKGGYYNELITLGNKMYALKNMDLKKEKNRIIIKMKGVNSKMKYDEKIINDEKKTIVLKGRNKFEGKECITFDDYKLIADGYKLTCDNMNFISGINDMVCKGKKLIKMSNTKSVKSLYDKGALDDENNITPLVVCDCTECDGCIANKKKLDDAKAESLKIARDIIKEKKKKKRL